MLKRSTKKDIISNVFDYEYSVDFSIDNTLIENIRRSIDEFYDKSSQNSENIEKNIILNKKKDLDKTFFYSDIFDDFKGKNPNMNIYNSYEKSRNIRLYGKLEHEIPIDLIVKNYYHIFKKQLVYFEYIFLYFFSKNIFFNIFNIMLSSFLLFISLFLYILFNIVDLFYFILYKLLLFFKKIIFITNKKSFLKIFLSAFFYIIFVSIKNIMMILRYLCNITYNLFNNFDHLNDEINNANLRNYFFKINKNGKINREKRDPEHISLFNFVAMKSKQKMNEMAKHNLDYLNNIKNLELKEFAIAVDYKKLPDCELKNFYKNRELLEKKEMEIIILNKFIKIKFKKFNKSKNIFDRLDIISNKVLNIKIKNNTIANKKLSVDSWKNIQI